MRKQKKSSETFRNRGRVCVFHVDVLVLASLELLAFDLITCCTSTRWTMRMIRPVPILSSPSDLVRKTASSIYRLCTNTDLQRSFWTLINLTCSIPLWLKGKGNDSLLQYNIQIETLFERLGKGARDLAEILSSSDTVAKKPSRDAS